MSERWLGGEVAALFDRNRQRGTGSWNGVDYDFVCPSTETYPFQWFWDSCFHAIALSHFDTERAESEIAGLLANQQDDGLIPHVILWQRDRFEASVSTYAIAFRTGWLSDQMQPPLLAEAVAATARRGRGAEYIAEVLPSVRRFYDWCHDVRDPDGDGLIAVLQADETGLDHSPKFDEYLGIGELTDDEFLAGWHRVADRYAEVGRRSDEMFSLDRFVVEDVMVNTIYAENQRVLADLCADVGEDDAAGGYRSRADHTERALLDKAWDADRGLFFDLAGLVERPLEVNTVTCLFPLLLRATGDEVAERLVRHLTDPAEYDAAYPVPSVAMNERGYDPGVVARNLVWRGPTWMSSNWYLVRGLRRHGHHDLATHITERSVELVRRSGFREYYNPETGEGNGAPDFSWTGIVLDMVQHEDDR